MHFLFVPCLILFTTNHSMWSYKWRKLPWHNWWIEGSKRTSKWWPLTMVGWLSFWKLKQTIIHFSMILNFIYLLFLIVWHGISYAKQIVFVRLLGIWKDFGSCVSFLCVVSLTFVVVIIIIIIIVFGCVTS